VDGGFPGKTMKGFGIGSMKTAVEAASPAGYGAAPHSVPITMGAGAGGSLSLYYKTGFLTAYDVGGLVTTFTVCKAYGLAPDGTLDGQGARLHFAANGDIKGSILALPPNGQNGTSFTDVKTLLGPPDGEGNVMLGGQQLHLLSYGFIGIEV